MSEPDWKQLALDLFEGVRAFRNEPKLEKRRKLRATAGYSEMCRAWEAIDDALEERECESIEDERIELWAHLVSEHAGVWDPKLPFEMLCEIHRHEHEGPGTIRNHDETARNYSLKKLGHVLSEAEDDCGPRCAERGQCADLDGSGACFGCGRWLGDNEKNKP